MIKLDYSLQTPEERNALVQQILEDNPDVSDAYLEVLADYLVLCMEKQEKKERKLLTDNRMATVTKRETSFEGLVSQLENGEDGIYNLMTENKNMIFQPKVTITKKDLEDIPLLRQLREAIAYWENKMEVSEGRDKFIIKKTIIELPTINKMMKERINVALDAIGMKGIRIGKEITYDYSEQGNILNEILEKKQAIEKRLTIVKNINEYGKKIGMEEIK